MIACHSDELIGSNLFKEMGLKLQKKRYFMKILVVA